MPKLKFKNYNFRAKKNQNYNFSAKIQIEKIKLEIGRPQNQ